MNDLQRLFVSQLKTILDTEHQLAGALSELQRDARSSELKARFGEANEEATLHRQRLEEVFDSIGESPARTTCHAIRAIVQEGQLLAAELEGRPTIDAALNTTAVKSEAFRITCYGTLCAWAEELSHQRAASLLRQSLVAARQAKERGTRLSESLESGGFESNRDLERLFVRQLRQMFDGEHLLVSALGEVEFYAASRLLKLAVRHHLRQTQKHVERLEQAFLDLKETADRRPCDGIEGIIDDAQVRVMEFLGNSALDAALIASAQQAEHYEMAAYENLCGWATKLGREPILHLLQSNLAEEAATDKHLTLLAEALRNRKARRQESTQQPVQTAEFLKLATHGE